MSRERAAERARLRQVRVALRGGREAEGGSNALYAVYVAVIAAGSYGVPAAQQLFRSLDEHWLARAVTSPLGALALAATAACLLAVGLWLGRVRGPVVPELSYVDLVASSPMSRPVTLGRHWRLSLLGCLVAGFLTGVVVGAGLAIAGVTRPWIPLPTGLGGLVFGALFAGCWLWGQVLSWPTGRRGPSTFLNGHRSLAQLHITGLRAQAASNIAIGGAVLAGDLRSARLDVVRRTTRGRRTRLRAGSPVAVVVRRDALGMRRAPVAAVLGLLACAVGILGLLLSLGSPSTPTLAPLGSLLPCYFGFGAWCEGLRMHADNVGTSDLFGLDHRERTLAHLILPAALFVVVSVVLGVALWSSGRIAGGAVVWPVATLVLLVGAHLMAAFRGLPPAGVFNPRQGVPVMVLWYLRPLLVVLVVGTLASALAARSAVLGAPLLLLLAGGAGAYAWGMSLMRRLHDADRI